MTDANDSLCDDRPCTVVCFVHQCLRLAFFLVRCLRALCNSCFSFFRACPGDRGVYPCASRYRWLICTFPGEFWLPPAYRAIMTRFGFISNCGIVDIDVEKNGSASCTTFAQINHAMVVVFVGPRSKRWRISKRAFLFHVHDFDILK